MKKKNHLIRCGLIISGLIFLYFPTWCFQDTLKVVEGFEEVSIQKHGSVLVTQNQALNIDSILMLSNRHFLPLSETGNTFSPSDNVYWFKTVIQNPTDTIQSLIFELRNPFVNRLQFFEIRNGSLKSSMEMGDDFLFQQRIIEHPSYLYPLTLTAGETVELYMFQRKLGESMMIKGSLWQTDVFHTRDQRKNFSFSVFIGFLACIVFFIILVALITRQPMLFYFSMYVVACTLSILLALGYGFMYIWADVPLVNDLGYFFLMLYFFSLIALTRSFLNSKIHAPRFDKFLWLAQFLFIIFLPLPFFHEYLPMPLKVFLTNLSHIFYLVVVTAVISTVVTVFRKTQNYWTLLFLFGFLFGMVAISLFTVEYQGWVNNYWSTLITMLCIAADFTILMLVIGNQIRLMYIQNLDLKQEVTESQLAAASTLLAGQRIERQRLSEELHDGISIRLGLLRLHLSKILKSHPEGSKMLNAIGDLADEIRDFSHAISPFDTKKQTLQEAIETLLYDVEEQSGIQIQLDSNDFLEEKLTNKDKHAVFQTIKELLNNTLKHADATFISVTLKNTATHFQLTFSDNGKGFEFSLSSLGIGLKIIQSRAKLLHGDFIIQSDANGSKFEFLFPLKD